MSLFVDDTGLGTEYWQRLHMVDTRTGVETLMRSIET